MYNSFTIRVNVFIGPHQGTPQWGNSHKDMPVVFVPDALPNTTIDHQATTTHMGGAGGCHLGCPEEKPKMLPQQLGVGVEGLGQGPRVEPMRVEAGVAALPFPPTYWMERTGDSNWRPMGILCLISAPLVLSTFTFVQWLVLMYKPLEKSTMERLSTVLFMVWFW